MDRQLVIIGGGFAVLALGVAYYVLNKAPGEGTQGFFETVGENAGGAVVDLAGGVLSGAVKGVGDIVGVPRTNKTQCQLDVEAGRTWDASFSCDAGTFIKSLF